ncbi:MAG: phospholipase [Pseudomonadota bacterium]
MTRRLEWVVVAAALACSAVPAGAWSNHTLGAWPALAAMPEINAAPAIRVETLDAFLAAEARGLEQLLQREEAWARANVPLYPPRPDALAFRADGTPAELRQRLVAALRINPGVKLNLFVQARPGESASGKATLPWTEVTTLRRASTAQESVFLRLREGDRVAPLDVVASATDEPDYGMDIGLWDDNGTPYGQAYGFGKQPFGNSALEFASQAPFHMGFFHEANIVYKAADFLRRTYPEYRIHLWQSLAAYALQTAHPYWGWRFAGWALHYIEDLTQPYHASVLPGVGVPRLLWINTLDLLGVHHPKKQAITLVSNRHLSLENYHYHRMRNAYVRHDAGDALVHAIKDTSADAGRAAFGDDAARAVISRESNALADATDSTLEQSLPRKYVSDPAYVLGETEPGLDLYGVLNKSPPPAREAMTGMVAGLLRNFGAHSRAFVRSLLVRSQQDPRR